MLSLLFILKIIFLVIHLAIIYITNSTLHSGIFIYYPPSQYISNHIRNQNPSPTKKSHHP